MIKKKVQEEFKNIITIILVYKTNRLRLDEIVK